MTPARPFPYAAMAAADAMAAARHGDDLQGPVDRVVWAIVTHVKAEAGQEVLRETAP